MPDFAVSLHNVTKSYSLAKQGNSSLARLFGFGKKSVVDPKNSFIALKNISIDIPKGQRVAIVGRNGAGKTTLLKLLCENFAPTSGEVKVNGTVQALLGLGVGFHQEYTGRQNVKASLKYNGLAESQLEEAIADVEAFCELGQFFDQPFKSYSSGMQARLMFATATAVNPEILIIDEVLGAGDAYFIAKSKVRVQKLVDSGCTMILVSHSTQQVLELCSKAIWLDQGEVRMEDEAFLVVKAYEEFLHGPISRVEGSSEVDSLEQAENGAEAKVPEKVLGFDRSVADVRLQEPMFRPHSSEVHIENSEVDLNEFYFTAPGGISRWESDIGLKICGFAPVTERGISDVLVTMRPALLQFTLQAEVTRTFDCRYGIAIHDYSGNCLTRIFSPGDKFSIGEGEKRVVQLTLNPNQIGPGEYVVGISVLENAPLELLNSTNRYDLLSRSFAIKIELPESLGALGAMILHSGEWEFVSLAVS